MGRHQRRKGQSGEREFFKMLSLHMGTEVKRKLGQAREGGNDGDLGPLRFEVKRYRRFAVLRHMEQVQEACGEGERPIVALREDGGRWHFLLTADDFFYLLDRSKVLSGGSAASHSSEVICPTT